MENKFTPCGGALLQKKIDDALADGSRQVVITGNYEIEQTVLIPSDFTLILENCHLRMADDTFCNMFRNQKAGTEEGKTIEGADRNIVIEGRGKAILDGGNYNGLSESNNCKDGRPHISVNNLILFHNVEHFRVSGLFLCNQRWWAMNFLFCRFGHIHDIEFKADDRRRDKDGNIIHGHICDESTWYDVIVRNADGLDLRCGCRNILVENISGFTQDDTVAMTGLPGKMETDLYTVRGMSTDICNITVRNVHASASCAALVRLLNQGGIKLYNILVDGVMDTSADCPHLDRTPYGIRVGDRGNYARHSVPGETYNIVIRNVFTRTKCAMVLGGSIQNMTVENLLGFDGGGTFIENNNAKLIDCKGILD